MNIESIKSQFPIFKQETPLGQELVYLDTASSAQKPQSVIDAISGFYSGYYANTGRGSYWPAHKATTSFEAVREKVAQFIKAESKNQIVFTSGTTDSINKLVNAYVIPTLKAGDQVLVSEMEHHANLVPWQEACKAKGAQIKAIPLTDQGALDYQGLNKLLQTKTAFVSITAISNVLGTVNDIESIVEAAHEKGAKVFVDAAQAIAHKTVDVSSWKADFVAFSAHKLYGPTGVGVLYLAGDFVDIIRPLLYGGGMITSVSIKASGYRKGPQRHEAGTQNIAGVIGLGAAIDFMSEIPTLDLHEHLDALTSSVYKSLSSIEGLCILGPKKRAGVISFTIEGIHPHDLSTFLNEHGICIRAGHHCAQPLMNRYKVPATSRVSFGVYNSETDIQVLVKSLTEAKAFFL